MKKLPITSPAFEILEKWRQLGIIPELDETGSLAIKNFALDETGETFLHVPEEALQELSTFYSEILDDLKFWEQQRAIVAKIWLQHDKEYRERYCSE